MSVYSDEERERLEKLNEEYEQQQKICDPIRQRGIVFHSFVSKSKGRHKDKRRYRKYWEEVELVSSDFGKSFSTKPKWDLLARDVWGESDQQACDKLMEILRER